MASISNNVVHRYRWWILLGALTVIVTVAGLGSEAKSETLSSYTVSGNVPVADGMYRQWVPISGVDHYKMVNTPVTFPDGVNNCAKSRLKTYNYTTQIGSRDSYVIDLSSVPDGATITGLTFHRCIQINKSIKNTVSISHFKTFYQFDDYQSPDFDSGGVYQKGPASYVASSQSVTYLNHVKSNNSRLEIGILFEQGDYGARVAHMSADIMYTLPPTVGTTTAP